MPRTTAEESENWTKTLEVAGAKGMAPLAVAKIANVGVELVLIVVVTLAAGAARHTDVDGFVWQIVKVKGSVVEPVFAVAVIDAPDPMLTVATAKAFEPFVPGIATIPSPVCVAASAIISGTGVVDAENNSVLTPG